VFFLISNLLLQMGAAAARVMLVPPSEFNSLKPYDSDRIGKDFTILGMRSPQLLAAIDSLEPIQQTAELITDQPEPAQLPASGKKQTIADKIKPLFAQFSGVSDTLSGLLNKVSTLLPSKSPSQPPASKAPSANPVPTPAEPVVGVEGTGNTESKEPLPPSDPVSNEVSSPSIETVETVETPTGTLPESVEAKVENAVEEIQAEAIAEETVSVSEEVSEQVSDAVPESTSDTNNDTQTAPENSSENSLEAPSEPPTNQSDDAWN
jgi:hypothetical protein